MLLKNKKYYIFTNPKGIRYIGANKLIGKYKPEKDWDEICIKTAKKRGLDPLVLKAEWDANGEASKKRGVVFHEYMENYYKSLKKPNVYFTPKDLYVYEDCSLKDNSAYIEKILWDDEYKIFGIADFIQVKKGLVNIIDYKTNAKIDFDSFGDEKMLPPLDHLPNCSYYEYGLQASFYMWLALKANPSLKQGEIYLEHALFEDNPAKAEKVKIPINYYKDEINTIIKNI